MHYRNGREAKNGDKVLQIGHDGRIVSIGVLHDAKPGNDFCNGSIAPIASGLTGACMCDCLHMDDVIELLKEKGLDKRPTPKASPVSTIGAMIIAALLLLMGGPAAANDYDFAKLVNYEFATTGDVRRVEAKVDAIGSKVDALASEVGSLKTFIHAIPKPAIADTPADPLRQVDQKSRGRIVVVSDGRPEIDLKLGTAFRALQERDRTWTIGRDASNSIQFVNSYDSQAVDAIKAEACLQDDVELPLIAYLEDGGLVRRWAEGCTTPLDAWTFGWLQTGTDRRPVTIEPEKATAARSGRYPLTGGWWSVEGKINPPASFIVNHLLSGSQHRGQFSRDWLESLSYAELQSVHTDDHTGRLKTQYVGKPLSERLTANLSPPKPIVQKPSATVSWVTFPQTARSSCPGGVCPLVSGVRYRKR